MKKIFVISFLFFFFLSGCSSLTEQGSKVSISHTVWQGCRFVSSISGSETDSNSDLALRNKAGKLGANLVVVTGYANHGILYGQIPSKGDAYQCETAAEKKAAEEKLRIEAEKKLAEEKAHFEAEKKLAEEKAKADELARIEAEKAKIEEEKKQIAEERTRLEKLKTEAEANLLKSKLENTESKKEANVTPQDSRQPAKDGATTDDNEDDNKENSNPNSVISGKEEKEKSKEPDAMEKKTKLPTI